MPTKNKKAANPLPPKKKIVKKRAAKKPPAKKEPKKKPGPEKSKVSALLEVGRVANIKIYQMFLTRISKGEQLQPSEYKHFKLLERELEREVNENGKDTGLVESFAAAAEYCGVSTRTISFHVSRGNIRQRKDGMFEKSQLDAYLEKRGRKPKGATAGKKESVLVRKDRADLRWRLARAQREEILIAQLKKQLISRDDVDRETAARVAAVASGLEAFAERLPGILAGKSQKAITEIIRGEVWTLRDDFAKRGEYI